RSARPDRPAPRPPPGRETGVPPAAAAPPPQGTIGTAASAATSTTARTSSSDPGKTAASGVRPSTTYGPSSIPVRTLGDPTTARSLSSTETSTGPLPRPALEALGETLLFDRMRSVGDRPRLAARLPGWEDLAGIAAARRIEGVLGPAHELEIRRREDERHEIGLLEADAVLARDRSADLGAELHDGGARFDHARFLAGPAWVVEDIGMEVAVPGVEDVAD